MCALSLIMVIVLMSKRGRIIYCVRRFIALMLCLTFLRKRPVKLYIHPVVLRKLSENKIKFQQIIFQLYAPYDMVKTATVLNFLYVKLNFIKRTQKEK